MSFSSSSLNMMVPCRGSIRVPPCAHCVPSQVSWQELDRCCSVCCDQSTSRVRTRIFVGQRRGPRIRKPLLLDRTPRARAPPLLRRPSARTTSRAVRGEPNRSAATGSNLTVRSKECSRRSRPPRHRCLRRTRLRSSSCCVHARPLDPIERVRHVDVVRR
jgi:hypothetical protein